MSRFRRCWVLSAGAIVAMPIALTLVVAGAAWIVAITRMRGMDMGPGSDLGSLSFFAGTWMAMMAAMMLPSAIPAIVSFVRTMPRRPVVLEITSPVFAIGYLAVWEAAGLIVFAAGHGIRVANLDFLAWGRAGPSVAGAAVVVAGLYELTPLKRACLDRCRAHVEQRGVTPLVAGWRYGGSCVGCSAGLMLMLFALGAMSVTWMLVVAALVFMEKVPRFGTRLVVPIATLLVGLGLWVALDASSVPGLTSPM